jgi:hypothetical protein
MRALLPLVLPVLVTACAADAAPIEVDLTVAEAGPGSPVPAGTACTLRMQPAWRSGVNCQLLLRCQHAGRDHDLFGGARIGGYSVCDTAAHAFTRAFDGEPVRDGDPALTVDLEARTASWRGPHEGEHAELRFTSELRSIAPWDEHAR